MENGCSTLRAFPAAPRILRSTECIWVSGATSRCVLQGLFLFFFFLPMGPIPLIAILATDCCNPSLIFCVHPTHVLLACASLPLFFLFFLHSLSSFFFPPVCVCVNIRILFWLAAHRIVFFFVCVYCWLSLSVLLFFCVCVFAFSLLLYISGSFFFLPLGFFLIFQTPHTGNSLSSLFCFLPSSF